MGDTWSLSAVASLVEDLDKKLLVVLRDGSKILGTLRSFDQFANIVLEGAVERIIVGSSYSDIPLGLYIVRGENVVLMVGRCSLNATRRTPPQHPPPRHSPPPRQTPPSSDTPYWN